MRRSLTLNKCFSESFTKFLRKVFVTEHFRETASLTYVDANNICFRVQRLKKSSPGVVGD